MWVLVAAALLVASTALAEEEDICMKSSYEICFSGIPVQFPTNEKELDERCPLVMEQNRCMQEHAMKCESPDLGEITAQTELVQDVCRKGSSLNEAIAPNMECIKENVVKECYESSRRVPEAYEHYLNPTEEEMTKDMWRKIACMSYAYDVACAVNAVSLPCGSTVKDALLEVERRLDWMEKRTACPRSVREEIAKDIPAMEISLVEKVLLEELLLDI